MYYFFRLLNLVALIALVTAMILKIGHSFDSSIFFSIGIIGSSFAYLGKTYWDYRRKTQNKIT